MSLEWMTYDAFSVHSQAGSPGAAPGCLSLDIFSECFLLPWPFVAHFLLEKEKACFFILFIPVLL